MADTGERPTEVTSRYEPSQEDLRVLAGYWQTQRRHNRCFSFSDWQSRRQRRDSPSRG